MTEQGNKPDYWYQQSAVIPFLFVDGELSVVIITSLSSKRWIVPKGIIEKDMSPEDSAAKEAFEEAGLIGTALPCLLGEYQRRKWGGICNIQVFPMKVEKILDHWEEAEVRQRLILPLDQAIEKIHDKNLKILTKTLPNHLS